MNVDPKPELTAALHRAQIEAYTEVRPIYENYANALKRVIEVACKGSFPDAFVQARAKDLSSFAEKVARKFDKYPDAVHQMTDLCGGRVIVQTDEQVRAVRCFIEDNFAVLESDDKALHLGQDGFGYRDMHYVVRLKSARARDLGFTAEEIDAIGTKAAEIQVRTWLQHAWADTLHDRMYKNTLTLSPEVKRTGALLAALMEEGDRNFNVLANELDGLIANYTAFATLEEVEKEIATQRLIFANTSDERKRSELAVKLAILLAATEQRAEVVKLLSPFVDFCHGPLRCRLLLQLGQSLCRLHKNEPHSSHYLQGLEYLRACVSLCSAPQLAYVPNRQSLDSLHARALARLGGALEAMESPEAEARDCVHRAYDLQPANPYYLAGMLGLELRLGNGDALSTSMATTIRTAIRTCKEHAVAGIEMPFACFVAGRLSLLLNQGYEALAYYARGIRFCLDGRYVAPPDIIETEQQWIRSVHPGIEPPTAAQWAIDLLALSSQVRPLTSSSAAPTVIVAGGSSRRAPDIEALLIEALGRYQGLVVSGGTTVGVPGAVADAAENLKAEGRKEFQLIGYRPSNLPDSVAGHAGYDEQRHAGAEFSPDQILRYWSDILARGAASVFLLGFGGGPLSALEYRIALALGASVGAVGSTGDAAASLLADPLWAGAPRLFDLPSDGATLRAFITPSRTSLDPATCEGMARDFHTRYVQSSPKRLPPNMRPWDKLDPTFQEANLAQARYCVEILEAAGFTVRPASSEAGLAKFTDEEVERMSELEHGRWNVERLRDGWRYGKVRDDATKIHDCLLSWSDLPEDIRGYDRDAVRAFPQILAKAGLALSRSVLRG